MGAILAASDFANHSSFTTREPAYGRYWKTIPGYANQGPVSGVLRLSPSRLYADRMSRRQSRCRPGLGGGRTMFRNWEDFRQQGYSVKSQAIADSPAG
jgi:hypothetical protein